MTVVGLEVTCEREKRERERERNWASTVYVRCIRAPWCIVYNSPEGLPIEVGPGLNAAFQGTYVYQVPMIGLYSLPRRLYIHLPKLDIPGDSRNKGPAKSARRARGVSRFVGRYKLCRLHHHQVKAFNYNPELEVFPAKTRVSEVVKALSSPHWGSGNWSLRILGHIYTPYSGAATQIEDIERGLLREERRVVKFSAAGDTEKLVESV